MLMIYLSVLFDIVQLPLVMVHVSLQWFGHTSLENVDDVVLTRKETVKPNCCIFSAGMYIRQ